MGRPELAMALESISRQDYPLVETIVVDATGGGHPPLPSFPLTRGHVRRVVGGERALPRAFAANVGLLEARGDWLCFLDDDDTYESHFVSAMVDAGARHPAALVVYGRSRLLSADGKVERLFGAPFNRALMHYGPLFHWCAALIRRKVVELGCRFDEALAVCEDRDFLAQIARYSDFAFVPVVGFNYHAYRGTSGTTETNRDTANTIRFDALLRAKVAGEGAYHSRRATRMCTRAIYAYRKGNSAESRNLLETLLREYPDDPNALHGLARLELDQGLLDSAVERIDRAVDINPFAAEFRLTRATILDRLGRQREARAEALAAATEPALRRDAGELLSRMDPATDIGPRVANAAASAATSVPRMGPCPCGSGRRYKQCCGRPAAESARLPSDRLLERVRGWLVRGEARRAQEIVDGLAPTDVGSAELSRTAGEICLELARFEQAYAFLERSAKLAPSTRTGALLHTCCNFMWRTRTYDAVRATVLALRDRIEKRAQCAGPSSTGPIHVLAASGVPGTFANQAVHLARALSPRSGVRLWSTMPLQGERNRAFPIEALDPPRGAFPHGGTLVLAGHHYDCGFWWQRAAFDRVVILVTPDFPEELVHRMVEIEETARTARIDFVFCSRHSRDLFGLPGAIKYPMVDVPQVARTMVKRGGQGSLVVGSHGLEGRMKHHPNDPAFFREVMARGHRLSLLGLSGMQAAFDGDPDPRAIEFLDTSGVGASTFLGGLDCFLYRGHPQIADACGSRAIEAMAMSLPVIVFRSRVGAAEVIEHGHDGFLVETEAEALACLDRLAADHDLRAAIGANARRKVTTVMANQQARIAEYFVGAPGRSKAGFEEPSQPALNHL
jgi:tetratricopeptide (TPR) repeat protein